MALLKIRVREEIRRSLACFSFIFERSLVVSLMNDVKFKTDISITVSLPELESDEPATHSVAG